LPGYHHDYLKFYQLPNSKLCTHRMLFFSREATSETYGPWVSSLIYLPLQSIFICFCFQIYISKNPKIPCCTLFYFAFIRDLFIQSITTFSRPLAISGVVAQKGLTTPLIRRVARICYLCAGAIHVVLRGSPTGSITLVSSLSEIPTVVVLHHPFLFGENTDIVQANIKMNFWRRCRGDII